MDSRQLKTFITVSKTLSFTKASKELFMSQPAVSNSISSLEKILGVKLINRDRHNVTLTTEGKEFLNYAERFLTVEMEAENHVRNFSAGQLGNIRIAILSSSAEVFSKCLTQFSQQHSKIQIHVDIKEGIEMMRAINEDTYDLYFANHYMIPENKNIECVLVDQIRLCLFVHSDDADKIDVDDWSTLADYHFVSVRDQDFAIARQIRDICLSRGVEPDVINYYNRADSLLMAVNSGVGIAILPETLNYSYNLPNIVSLPITGEDTIVNSVIAWHSDKLKPEAQSFLRLKVLKEFKPFVKV